MKTRYLLLLSVILSIFGCKNELDLNSEYSQSLVIYGILNLKDSFHYVRIQKSYYSEDNGIYAARFIDSICPKTEDIEIYMEELLDGEIVDGPIYLESTNEFPKDSGFFANERNLVYRFNKMLKPGYSYKISVYDKETNVLSTGTTDLLGGRNYEYNFSETRYYTATAYNMEVLKDYEFFDQFWKEDGRVKRFLYKEKYQGNEYLRFVDYKPFYDHKNVKNALITDSIGCQFSDYYLQFLAKHIPVKQGVVREVVGVDHIVTFPDDNMVFYLYNCNTTDIFHYLKFYSNIENGQGLFASKYFLTFFAQKLYPATIDSVAHGRFTGHLGFKGYYDPKKTKEYMNKY